MLALSKGDSVAKKNVTFSIDETALAHLDSVADTLHVSRSALITVLAEFAYDCPSVVPAMSLMGKAARMAPDAVVGDLALSALAADV